MRRLSFAALATSTLALASTAFGSLVLPLSPRLTFGDVSSRPGKRIVRTRQVRSVRLNRSRHWPYAATYKEARAMSPTPWTPVR